MPGEDGYSLIRRIRALRPESGGLVPAAAVTAYATAEDRAKALTAGYQIFLPKPVDPAELFTVVRLLARKALARP
jgi:CheY-like chemotaxis protein